MRCLLERSSSWNETFAFLPACALTSLGCVRSVRSPSSNPLEREVRDRLSLGFLSVAKYATDDDFQSTTTHLFDHLEPTAPFSSSASAPARWGPRPSTSNRRMSSAQARSWISLFVSRTVSPAEDARAAARPGA